MEDKYSKQAKKPVRMYPDASIDSICGRIVLLNQKEVYISVDELN